MTHLPVKSEGGITVKYQIPCLKIHSSPYLIPRAILISCRHNKIVALNLLTTLGPFSPWFMRFGLPFIQEVDKVKNSSARVNRTKAGCKSPGLKPPVQSSGESVR